RLLDRLIVAVIGPAEIQEAVGEGGTTLGEDGLQRYLLYPLGGGGVFTSRGEVWRRQRKLMAAVFSPAQIGGFAQGVVTSAQGGAETWKDGATLDMWRETTRITMAIAGMTLFGAETFSDADELGNALTVSLKWVADQQTSFLPIAQVTLLAGVEKVAPR